MSERRPRPRHRGTDSDAHDILAAEAFAVPEADPTIHPHPVVLPGDPTGILEAHDILAAEEFAMPAARAHPGPSQPRGMLSARSRLLAGGLLALLVLRRRRRG